MSQLSKQIREYIRCPQFDGGYEYGEWGSLSLNKRKMIKELCEECERQEKFADAYFKETQSLKHQLAEKDKEIKELQEQNEELLEGAKQMLYEGKEVMQSIRHQVCEEIRLKFANWYTKEQTPNVRYWWSIMEILNQIEQGESK